MVIEDSRTDYIHQLEEETTTGLNTLSWCGGLGASETLRAMPAGAIMLLVGAPTLDRSKVPTFVAADNTTDYIHQLEQKISDLESHAQASEQKQAAVLSSILSKLQAQEEKIQEHTDDLQNLTTNAIPSTSSTGSQRVAFEARTTSDSTRTTLIKFNRVPFNDGDGYNAHRGTFIAPTTGTYQFWFTVYVSEQHYTSSSVQMSHDTVRLIAGNADVGPSYGGFVAPAETTYGMHHLDVRAVQGLHVVPLTAGNTVYVRLASAVNVKAGSSFGGVLLA